MTQDISTLRSWSAKLCGYTRHPAEYWPWYSKGDSDARVFYEAEWQPDQNIAQAFEVLDATMQLGPVSHFDFHCMSPSRRWSAHVDFSFDGKKSSGHVSHENRCMGILLACYAAVAALEGK